MPTWKQVDGDGAARFQHLCSTCSQARATALAAGGWRLVRSGEPVSCRDCVLKCLLTAEGAWGAEDVIRYAVCDRCPELDACELKGRYFC